MVHDELRAMDIRGSVEPGGVAWSGNLESLARANLGLRTASRVLVRVAEFRARTFFELERHDDGSVEISYFGLMPMGIGQGLGRALLTTAIDEAWSLKPVPSRVWLHTCTLDHPAALANYLARGFQVTHSERYTVDLRT